MVYEALNDVQREEGIDQSLENCQFSFQQYSVPNPLKEEQCREIAEVLLAMSIEVQEQYESKQETFQKRLDEASPLMKLLLKLRQPKNPHGAVDKDDFIAQIETVPMYERSQCLRDLYKAGLIEFQVEEILGSQSRYDQLIRGIRPTELLREEINRYPRKETLELVHSLWRYNGDGIIY